MSSFAEQWKQNWKRRLICSGVAGVLLGTCLVFGYCIENMQRVSYGSAWLYVALFLCCGGITAAVYLLYTGLDCRKKTAWQEKQYRVKQKAARILGYAGLLFVGWMPSFLGVYPGWFNYDAPWQLSMYADKQISAHHPVLHTVVMGWILEHMNAINGTYNKGIALYLILQMAVIALCFGYVIYYMGKRGVGKIGRGITLLWFILFPTVVLHVMSVTKDSLFAAFFVVLCIFTYELLRRPEQFFKNKWNMAVWVMLFFLCIVFRQNSLYAFVLAAVPCAIALRRYWKPLLVMAVSVCVLYALYIGPFYSAFSVTPGSKAEFLSVPCQQVVKVYLDKNEQLSDEQKAEIEEVFQEEAFLQYRAKLADFTKGNLNLSVISEHSDRYLKLYTTLLGQYPDVYLDAFFLNTYGFWYPDATVDIYEDGVSYYFATEQRPPAVPNSKIPFVLTYYKNFYTGFPVQNAGPLTWILSMALYFYLFFLTFLYAVYKKNGAGILTGVGVLLLWMTYLLGPAALVRYVLFLFILPPFEAVMMRDLMRDIQYRKF